MHLPIPRKRLRPWPRSRPASSPRWRSRSSRRPRTCLNPPIRRRTVRVTPARTSGRRRRRSWRSTAACRRRWTTSASTTPTSFCPSDRPSVCPDEPSRRAFAACGHGAYAMTVRRIVVGISGASGIVYGVRVLEALRGAGFETHLVMTRSAQVTLGYEMSLKVSEVQALADVNHRCEDIGASISSGSFATVGMIVAPCSIRSISEIATGVTSSLLTRAADVVLKERRRLVLMVRETPLHLGHLRSMAQVTEIGAIVMPPVPALYARPQSVDEVVNHSVGRVLDLFGIDNALVRRWGESDGSLARTEIIGRKA